MTKFLTLTATYEKVTVLVNVADIAYVIADLDGSATRIYLRSSGDFVNVNETLEKIGELLENLA